MHLGSQAGHRAYSGGGRGRLVVGERVGVHLCSPAGRKGVPMARVRFVAAQRASAPVFCRRLANGLEGVRIESKGRLSTLTFFNVSEKDYGNYTCVATNKLGNTNASIILYGRCPGFFTARSSVEEVEEEQAGGQVAKEQRGLPIKVPSGTRSAQRGPMAGTGVGRGAPHWPQGAVGWWLVAGTPLAVSRVSGCSRVGYCCHAKRLPASHGHRWSAGPTRGPGSGEQAPRVRGVGVACCTHSVRQRGLCRVSRLSGWREEDGV